MNDTIELDFPATLARQFPRAFSLAWDAVEDIVRTLPGTDFAALERRSPALRGFDWANYLRCSTARMVRVLDVLQRHADVRQVLDVGAYFGNFALMCRRAGYEVDAVDAYAEYGASLAKCEALLRSAGVAVHDFATAGASLEGLGRYEAVICAGVIEHIPHTPRLLLEALDARLQPGGLLLLDTPNLAYIYNRQRLARGESVFCPIELQYGTDLPFEGHHREYTADEVRWMLTQIGHEIVELDTFNYSLYGAGALTGRDAENFREMERDPTARELIFCVSRAPGRRANN